MKKKKNKFVMPETFDVVVKVKDSFYGYDGKQDVVFISNKPLKEKVNSVYEQD